MTLYDIPKGTGEAECKRCHAPVYWIEHRQKLPDRAARTIRLPIDTDVPGGSDPDAMTGGRGVNHLKVCPAEPEE